MAMGFSVVGWSRNPFDEEPLSQIHAVTPHATAPTTIPAHLADVLPRLARGIALRDVPSMAPDAWKLARASAGLPTA
jgi:hypothetical protein